MFTGSSSYKKLLSLKKKLKPSLKKWFDDDKERAASLSVATDRMIYDFSRQLINDGVLNALMELAEDSKLKDKIKSMFSGKKINVTENRAVLHTALRNLSDRPVIVDGKDVMPDVNAVLAKIKKFSDEVSSGVRRGATGKEFKNILAIGIGGSYLGPEYLAEACKPYAKPGMNLIFVANVDGTDFVRKTRGIYADETLVIVISKTFTTAETMKNAETAKQWVIKNVGSSPEVIRKHFIAVSTAKEKVEAFGIDPDNMFGFWDWVGGRFSATSAVGAAPLSLYIGFDNFHKILEGANWLDEHFLNQPLESNIPVIAGLIDIWNINFMGYNTRAILPYSQAWHRYPAHCQQVEMESNGKSVDMDGKPVKFDTGEVVFGEPGTNGQHSFYQLLHQGTQVIPCDFIGFKKPQYALTDNARLTTDNSLSHHEELMTNFFAQPDALAFGKADKYLPKNFPGDRPSNVFLLNEQGPFEAGVLLALVEHRTAVKGFIWNINSFDQFGVELGKVLGVDMRRRIALYKKDPSDPKVFEGLNSSTAVLLKKFLKD